MGSNHQQKNLSSLKATHILRYLLPLILLGLAVHLLLPQITTFEHSYQVMEKMVFWAVGMAVVSQIFSYLSSGYLLKALVGLSKNSLSILDGTIITLAGSSFGMVAGGMVGSSAAIYHWMQKKNISSESATLAGTIPALFNNIVLVLVSLAGLIHLLIVHQLTRLQGISFLFIIFLLLSLTGFFIWGLKNRESIKSLANRTGNWWAKLRHKEYEPEKTQNWLKEIFSAADMLISGGVAQAYAGSCFKYTLRHADLIFFIHSRQTSGQFGCSTDRVRFTIIAGKNGIYDSRRGWCHREYYGRVIYRVGCFECSNSDCCAGLPDHFFLASINNWVPINCVFTKENSFRKVMIIPIFRCSHLHGIRSVTGMIHVQ